MLSTLLPRARSAVILWHVYPRKLTFAANLAFQTGLWHAFALSRQRLTHFCQPLFQTLLLTQVNHHKLQQGDIVTVPTSLLASGRHKWNQILWNRADIRIEAKLKTLPQNAVLHVLNNIRWHYSYDSSVTRTRPKMRRLAIVNVFWLLEIKF